VVFSRVGICQVGYGKHFFLVLSYRNRNGGESPSVPVFMCGSFWQEAPESSLSNPEFHTTVKEAAALGNTVTGLIVLIKKIIHSDVECPRVFHEFLG